MNAVFHESAILHVTGQANYVDDLPTSAQTLTGRVVYSPHAHANIVSFDLTDARKVAGVHAILSYADIPGQNQMGPVIHDEACLAHSEVLCVGQAIFLIAAESEEIAREAEKKIKIEYEVRKPILTIDEAILHNRLLAPARKMERGEIEQNLNSALHHFSGTLETGAQEHWYLETQASLAIPGDGQEMKIFVSSQHPSETQTIVADVLGIARNEVTVEVRRMGGGFGGKETQGNHVAAWSALLATKTKRPVKIRLFRDDDQIMTGKRHPFKMSYDVGFNAEGKILALDIELHANAGCATDLSMAILERAMMHVDNAYWIPNIRVIGKAWKTNLPSNTAFRGFGGPQGMAVIEQICDRIARYLRKDAADIRRANFYGEQIQNVTHYGQAIEENRLTTIYNQLIVSSEYFERRKAIQTFNRENEFYKKGIALTPVKFGISFTTSFLNQAGALVNIYRDGSVLVNHGGTEMGQGLHTKIRQIAAIELGISIDRIKVNATDTSKVPNTSATAASAGTDLNGAAVKNAIEQIKFRLAKLTAEYFNEQVLEIRSSPNDIVFEDDEVYDMRYPKRLITFSKLADLAVLRQVSLSSTGFYRTPGVWFDREKGEGRPYHYFAFGMAVTEVLVDTLTGRHEIIRADILHDVGNSINAGIDIGQVEGGYIQGVGWCTTEECKWDAKGHLLNHSPDTYKIPGVQDIPKDFRVTLLQGAPNSNTIHNSKAVAEPPLMLALSCWLAIKDAISAVGDHTIEPDFSLPATHEVILLSIEKMRIKKEKK